MGPIGTDVVGASGMASLSAPAPAPAAMMLAVRSVRVVVLPTPVLVHISSPLEQLWGLGLQWHFFAGSE